MPFHISPDHPTRQIFGYNPGFDVREDRESLSLPYLMLNEWASRCYYTGRDGRHGIYFKDPVTKMVFVQERRLTYFVSRDGLIYFGGWEKGVLVNSLPS